MKTKILFMLVAFIISGTMVLAQETAKTLNKEVTKTSTEMQKDSVYYTCTMHPDVKLNKPGKCPQCGMDLVQTTLKPAEKKVIKSDAVLTYTCPMHSEVISAKPGKCPKCGMDLIVKK